MVEKTCLNCGGLLIRRRWKNGKLDSTHKNRKYCSIACCTSFKLKSPPPTANAGRRRAQKAFPLTKCFCGEDGIQRHHLDGNPLNNSPENIKILCQKCHAADHVGTGTWGRKKRLPKKTCIVCGIVFLPRKARDKLCKSKLCLKELGRISAARRWAK